MKAITGGRIVLLDKNTDGSIADGCTLIYDKGKIIGIVRDEVIPDCAERIDAKGGYILPGFVDIHVHGGGGSDFLDGTVEDIRTVTRTHALHGTTSILPTTLTCPNEVLFRSLDLIIGEMERGSGDGAEILGVHLEGPYFSGASKGAQAVAEQRIPTLEELEEINAHAKGHIVRWDAAPELPNMDLFAAWLREHGILGSIGHSAADAECSLEAFEKGFTHLTHMYCATTTEHKKDQKVHAGQIEAVYLEDGFTTELIGDGCHIPRETMQLVFKLKGAKKTALITDAMRAAGTDCERSILGDRVSGTPVIIEDGVAKLVDRTFFAGSIATLGAALRTAVSFGIPLIDAVRSITLTPAEIIGFDNRKGSLESGKDADIVITDPSLSVCDVIIGGRSII